MTMVERFNRHAEICKELHQIYIDKNKAYGDSFNRAFREFGIISAITRISDKYHRLTTLAKGIENNVKDESICDTCKDLANYAIMTIIALEEDEESYSASVKMQKGKEAWEDYARKTESRKTTTLP